ncbi:MAG: M20 family metallopeptidase [Planctomycetota bacterium]
MTHDYDKLVRSTLPQVIALQREIHADPEIGFDTVRTAARVSAALRSAGLSVRERVGQTGVVADLEVPGARERVAFRADMDALPMEEENDLPHRSRNPGAAHLCGHDAHTAMLVGAAQVLSQLRSGLRRSLRFIFQPNEECLPGGAPAMIADGCLDGVDRIYGMHVWPLLATGSIGIHPGPTMAQPDTFRVTLEGVGGHAAAPHRNRDPIVCGAQIVSALQTIVARRVDPLDSAVVSVTQFHAGTADNVIPATAELRGTIRSFRSTVGDECRAQLRQIVAGLAQALEVTAHVEITLGYPVVVNDLDACARATRSLHGVLPVDASLGPSLGGEDFAYYLQHVPGAFLFLGNLDPSQGIVHFCHHPRFRVDDNAMAHGLKAWLALGAGGDA